MWVISKSCDGLTATLLLKVTRKRAIRAHVRKLRAVATCGAAPPRPGSPGGCEEGPVDGAEAGQAYEDGDDPGHDAQVVVPEVLDGHGP